jgi:hypothetical protein
MAVLAERPEARSAIQDLWGSNTGAFLQTDALLENSEMKFRNRNTKKDSMNGSLKTIGLFAFAVYARRRSRLFPTLAAPAS